MISKLHRIAVIVVAGVVFSVAPFLQTIEIEAQAGGCNESEDMDACTRRNGWRNTRLWNRDDRRRIRDIMGAATWASGQECAEARAAARTLEQSYDLGWGEHRSVHGVNYRWGNGPANNFTMFDATLGNDDAKFLAVFARSHSCGRKLA